MNSLDDLFQQIIHTEQQAQQRRNFLNEIKLNVQTFKEKIKETEKECVCLTGQLAIKVQKLTEDELSYTLLQHKQESLCEQLHILNDEYKDLQNKTNSLMKKKEKDTGIFCAEVDEFVENYSLVSDGQAAREKEAKQEILNLREQYEQLKAEQQNYNQKKDTADNLVKKLQGISNEKEKLEEHLNELKLKYEEEKKSTTEKEKALNSPSKMPEFVKLQQQLEMLKRENLEEKCTELQKEMRYLQQLCWQKQVKERQLQQDLKRTEQQNSSIPVTNRVQLTNFTVEQNANNQVIELS